MQSLILITAAISGLAFAQTADVCSQVQLMSQYCTSQGAAGSKTGQLATIKMMEKNMDVKLKEIETRLRHTLADPPEVNYTFVEETITARFKGVEARVIAKLGSPPKVNYTAIEESISTRFAHLETLVNGDGQDGSSIVDYARITAQVGVKFKEIKAYVDAKFAQLINDSEAYQAAVETMDRRKDISDCTEISLEDAKLCNATGGVFDIYRGARKYEVFCDSYTDGGGWTVFQRRMDGSVNFNRTWNEYVNGFGETHKEFWLGLKNIHELLKEETHELRIDVMDKYGRVRFAKYGIFYVAGKSLHYYLRVQEHSGDIKNYLASGKPFSTIDYDHDSWGSGNCGEYYQGGWWYDNCGYSSLNAHYSSGNVIYWYGFKDIVRVEMKFRPLPSKSED